MRVLFIYPDLGSFLPPHYQHGIGYLSAALKKAGHQTRLFYLSEPWPREKLSQATLDYEPGLVCLSGTTHQFRYLRQAAEWIKAAIPKVPVICGGVHATLASEEVIAHPAIDMICRGEGEDALVELVSAIEAGSDHQNIRNLWVKFKGRLSKNPLRPLVEDLDSIPFADREIFNYQEILDKDDHRLSLLVGRGCPYDCSYCANQAKRELFKGAGKYVRMRSVENLLEEIAACARKYQIEKLDFNDDIFTLDRAWVREFAEKYPGRFSWPFRINVHAGTVDREMFEKLAQVGAEMVRVGVESGSERVRRSIMNRRIKESEILDSFKWAEQAGVKTWSFNMVGIPGETAEDALATYNLNRSLFPDHMQVSVFNPYPGTGLFELCAKQNFIRGELDDGYFVPRTALNFPSLSPAEIHNWHQRLVRLSQASRNGKALKRKLGGRRVLCNLIDELHNAIIETPVPDYCGEEYIIIYEEARRALIMHPRCRVKYTLKIEEPAAIDFGIMIHPGVYARGEKGGVRFSVSAAGHGEALRQIFCRQLDAKARTEDRGFFDFMIELKDFTPGEIVLEFATEALIPEKNSFNTAGFTNPMVVALTAAAGAKGGG